MLQIRLTEACNKTQIKMIKELYQSAFPLNERKPFSLILKKCKTGQMKILAIETEAGDFAGEAILILYQNIVLLDYFAIVPEYRNQGAGSQALQLLRQRYNGKKLILEIENTQISAPDQQTRIKRKQFYLRNGMTPLKDTVKLFGVEMELMTFSCEIEFEEYLAVFQNVFGSYAARQVKQIIK